MGLHEVVALQLAQPVVDRESAVLREASDVLQGHLAGEEFLHLRQHALAPRAEHVQVGFGHGVDLVPELNGNQGIAPSTRLRNPPRLRQVDVGALLGRKHLAHPLRKWRVDRALERDDALLGISV